MAKGMPKVLFFDSVEVSGHAIDVVSVSLPTRDHPPFLTYVHWQKTNKDLITSYQYSEEAIESAHNSAVEHIKSGALLEPTDD